MADNKLNLTVQFNGIDKLSPGLRTIIGLGKNGSEAMRDITREGGRARTELGKMEKDLSVLNKQLIEVKDQMAAGGLRSGLVLAERELGTAIAETNAKIAEQQRLIARNTVARERQARMVAIDDNVGRIRGAGHSMVSSGMATLMFAGMAMAPLYEIAHTAGEAQNLENRLRIMGLDNATVGALETNAKRAQVAGASYLDMLRYTVEAQGAFRESGQGTLAERINGAKTMVPILARMSFAAKAMGMEVPEEQERYLLRFIEQAGGMNDPRRAAAIADGVFRALQSSGGTVQASDYQQFMAAAGTSGMKLSQRAMFADFEPLIGELHAGAGVGLMSAYLRVNGVGRVLKQPAAEMRRLGLWAGGKNGMNDANTALFANDPVEFYRNVVLPAYAKAKINDPQRENALIFGRTGGMLFNLIDKQQNAIVRSRAAYAQSQGINPAYEQAKDSFFGQKGQMTAAWQDFLVVAGSKGGVLQMLVGAMRSATSALRALTEFGNAHPTAFRWIASALTWSLGLKLAWAAGKVLLGGLIGPAATLWGWFSKLRILGGLPWLFDLIAGSRAVGIAVRILISAVSPMFILVAAGVGLVAAVLYKHRTGMMHSLTLLGKIALYFLKPLVHAFEWVGAFLGKWIGKFFNFGAWLMEGLAKGIFWGADKVLGAIGHVGSLIIQKFADQLGIKSPSRVFMVMGHHIAEGLAVGVDRNAHRPLRAIARVGAGMAGAVALSASPAGAHGRAAAQVTINVYQQPGEDGHAFARRVAAIVRQEQRNAHNASYKDDF